MTTLTALFANPAIQSGALPFVVALMTALVLGLSASMTARYAGLAVLAGFIVAYVAALGLPPLWPKSSGQKIAAVALLAAFGGVYLEIVRASASRRMVLGIVLALMVIVWIGWRKVMAAPSLDHLWMVLIAAAAAVAVAASERDGDDGADKAVALLIVSLAMAGIAFIGSSASISQNAGALSAALGGLLIVNWPVRRFGLNAVARFVPVIVLTALTTQAALFTKAPIWAAVLLIPALFADRLADRWIPADSHRAEAFRPVLIAFLALVPAMASLAAAWFAAPSTGSSGGY